MREDAKTALTTLLIVGAWVALCLVLALFTGCTTAAPRAAPVLLPTVAAPALTPVKSSDVQCLSDAAYIDLVNRERDIWTWGAAEQAIINANNAKAEVK